MTCVCDPRQETNASLSRLMIGAEPPQLRHRQAQAGAVVLGVQALNLAKQDPFGMDLAGISFDVKAGEIVGVAGVSGNGQQELMAALSGEDPRAAPGSITLAGGNLTSTAANTIAKQDMLKKIKVGDVVIGMTTPLLVTAISPAR